MFEYGSSTSRFIADWIVSEGASNPPLVCAGIGAVIIEKLIPRMLVCPFTSPLLSLSARKGKTHLSFWDREQIFVKNFTR